MASIVIEIEDAQLQRVLDLFSQARVYQALIENDPTRSPIPNPETKLAFLARMTAEDLRRIVLEQEIRNQGEKFHQSQADPGVTGHQG